MDSRLRSPGVNAARLRKARKLLSLLAVPAFRRGLRLGVAAAVEHRAILAPLPVATIIDVGANVGQFTLLAITLHPHATVHAIEPLPAAAAVFARLFAGMARVRLHRVAAGAEAGSAPLHVSRRPDCSSLLPIGVGQVAFAPGSDAVGVEMVPVRRLDALLPGDAIVRPALLKLDVQGGELQTLLGAEGLLPRIDHVYVEVSFVPLYDGQPLAHTIIGHLAERGFALAGVNHPSFDGAGRCIQADLLFTRLPTAAADAAPARHPSAERAGELAEEPA